MIQSFLATNYGAATQSPDPDNYCGEGYYEQSPTNDPQGPESGPSRVLRGGSGNFLSSRFTRSAYRFGTAPVFRNNVNGFRLVRELD